MGRWFRNHLVTLAFPAVLAGCAPFRSEVPIVEIDAHGVTVPDEPKVGAQLTIAYDSRSTTQTLKSPVAHASPIGIELLGSSSLLFRKKSYAFELRGPDGKPTAAPLLGLGSNSDWVLHGPYSDKTLMRNALAYGLARQLRLVSPRTRLVELFLREGSSKLEYSGVYLLVEASGRSPNGLGIARLEPGDTTAATISGGYILEVDRAGYGEEFFTMQGDPMSTHPDTLLFVSPRDPVAAQRSWITGWFGSMEASLPPAHALADPNGPSRYLDLDSFVDFLLLQEMVKNVDAYRYSASMYKDRDGLLRMGPVWDFDLSMSNARYDDGCDVDGWMVRELASKRTVKVPPFWWRRLLADSAFVTRLSTRWSALRAGPFATPRVLAAVDSTAGLLHDAQRRNFTRWPVLGRRVWASCWVEGSSAESYYTTWNDEVAHLRSWLDQRLRWMDDHIATIGP
jgi:CotH kinase protein